MHIKTKPITRLNLFLLALVAIVFTVLTLLHSLKYGTLRVPPTADEAVYLTDAATRLIELKTEGIGSFFQQLAAHLPHSPYSTFMGMLAFSILGLREWGPYATNVIWVFLLLVSMSFFTNKYPRWLSVLVLGTVLLTPITQLLIYDFQPDGGLSLALAIGAVLIFRQRDWAAGLCFGIALLVKPSGFLFTLGIYGLSYGLTFALARQSNKSWSNAAKKTLLSLKRSALLMLLIAAPYYLWGAKESFDYFSKFFLTDVGNAWNVDLSLTDNLLHYLTGYIGDIVLGSRFFLFFTIIIAGQVMMIWKSKRPFFSEYTAYLIVVFASWVAVTVVKAKSIHFGKPFQMMLLVAAVWQLERVWILAASSPTSLIGKRLKKITMACIGAVGVLGVCLGLFNSPILRGVPIIEPQVPHQLDNSISNGIFETILAHMPADVAPTNPIVVFITLSGIPRVPRMAWLAMKRGVPLRFMARTFEPNASISLEVINRRADFVIAADSTAVGVLSFLPNAKSADEVLVNVKASKAFKQIATYPDGNGKAYYLFQKINPTTANSRAEKTKP